MLTKSKVRSGSGSSDDNGSGSDSGGISHLNNCLLFLRVELDLVQCQMADGDPGATPQIDLMVALATELKQNTSLHTLDLRHNTLDTNSIDILADALESNKALQTLDIRHNEFQSDTGRIINRLLLRNDSLKNVLLGHNTLGDKGACELSGCVISSSKV
jgi:hypothetical protein